MKYCLDFFSLLQVKCLDPIKAAESVIRPPPPENGEWRLGTHGKYKQLEYYRGSQTETSQHSLLYNKMFKTINNIFVRKMTIVFCSCKGGC